MIDKRRLMTHDSLFSVALALVVVAYFVVDKQSFGLSLGYFTLWKDYVPFSIAIQNMEIMHERCPQHLSIETAIK